MASINQGVQLKDYNKAVTSAIKHLQAARTTEPQVLADGFHRKATLAQVVTSDSLDRYIRANKIKGKEKAALLQVFETLAGSQSLGQNLTVVNVSELKALSTKLKGYAKTHNKAPLSVLSTAEIGKMGKTAKGLVGAISALEKRDFGKVKSEIGFSKAVDHVLEHMLVKANKGSPYLKWYELVNYTKGNKKVSNELKSALWKSFRYIGRTMTHGQTNETQICMDQRREAHRILMKLFAGASGTKKAIEKLAAKLN